MSKDTILVAAFGIALLLFVAYYTNTNSDDFIRYGIYRQEDPHPLSFPASIEYNNYYLFSKYSYKGFHKSGSFTGAFGTVFHTGGSSIEDIDYEWHEMDSTTAQWNKLLQADSIYKAQRAKN